MTGADSRNENRAALPGQPAEHADHHHRAVPADARQQGQDLGRPEIDGTQPASPADDTPVGLDRQARVLLFQRPLPGRVPSAGPAGARRDRGFLPLADRLQVGGDFLRLHVRVAPPRPLPGQQDEPVHEQEARGENRPAEVHPEQMLQRQPREPDRDRGHNDHPGQHLVSVLRRKSRGARCGRDDVPDRGEEGPDDPQPVPPEVQDHGRGGGDVQPHDEGQVRRLGLGHVEVLCPRAPDQRRDEHGVAQAGYREKLGDPLQKPDHPGFCVR